MRKEPRVPLEDWAEIQAPFVFPGAQTIDPPILQPLNLLLDLAGEAMRTRLFVVQAEGGQERCLRPDFTVAIAQAHVQSGATEGRYVYDGPAFRASPEADRAEEFVQLGLEHFAPSGADVVEGDGEAMLTAWRSAVAGGRKDLTLWLGDVGLFSALIESLALPPALAARLKRVAGRPRLLNAELARSGQAAGPEGGQLAAQLAGLSRSQAAALLEEVWALAGVEPVGGRGPAEIAARLVRKAESAHAPALTSDQAAAIREFMAISAAPAEAFARVRALSGKTSPALDAALETWTARLAALEPVVPAGRLHFAPALGHAFDYYDGLTFEVRSEALGPDRPVAVGGRYDGLLARLGGADDARAVGCMVRPWRAFSGGEQ